MFIILALAASIVMGSDRPNAQRARPRAQSCHAQSVAHGSGMMGFMTISVIASVFIGTSLDGFIARPNNDLDFLPEGGGEPHGYEEFMASVDAVVIGRN